MQRFHLEVCSASIRLARKLAVTVIVNLAGFGMRELQGRPRLIDAEGGAFDQSVAVADPDDLRQCQVGFQLSTLRP